MIENVRVPANYVPNERQRAVHSCPASEILVAGPHALAADALVATAVTTCAATTGAVVYLLRHTFTELEDETLPLVRRLCSETIPPLRHLSGSFASYNEHTFTFTFQWGSELRLGWINNDDDLHRYTEPALMVLFDQLDEFTREQYTAMRSRLTTEVTEHGWTGRMMSTVTDPSGWIRDMFMTDSWSGQDEFWWSADTPPRSMAVVPVWEDAEAA